MDSASQHLFNEFDIVPNETDRLAAFSELSQSQAHLVVVTSDQLTFIFDLIKLEKLVLLMKPIEQSRKLKAEEKVYLIFSISSGQYMMKGSLKQTREGIAVFALNSELRRLQRRKDFRVNTLQTNNIKLEIQGFKKNQSLKITDISAGGVSAMIPKALNIHGTLSQEVICELTHPSRSLSDLKGIVRHIDQLAEGERWGIEFNHLSTHQMQAMLALSLQAHRENYR